VVANRRGAWRLLVTGGARTGHIAWCATGKCVNRWPQAIVIAARGSGPLVQARH